MQTESQKSANRQAIRNVGIFLLVKIAFFVALGWLLRWAYNDSLNQSPNKN